MAAVTICSDNVLHNYNIIIKTTKLTLVQPLTILSNFTWISLFLHYCLISVPRSHSGYHILWSCFPTFFWRQFLKTLLLMILTVSYYVHCSISPCLSPISLSNGEKPGYQPPYFYTLIHSQYTSIVVSKLFICTPVRNNFYQWQYSVYVYFCL